MVQIITNHLTYDKNNQILEDTLIGRQLPPWNKSKKEDLLKLKNSISLIWELFLPF